MNDPIQDYSAPFIRRINLNPVQPVTNGSTPPVVNPLLTNAASRLSTNGNGSARTFDDRSDLLKDAENTFYGGGSAIPTPTPTPTPVPRFLPRANVTKDDLETYGAGSQYGFTSPSPRYY